MDAKQLKRDLETYAGYKCVNNQDLKVIEDSIFGNIMSFFRPITKDVFENPTISNNVSEDLRKEVVLNQFEGMKQVSKEYLIDELVVYFLSKAHNDWILEHKENLEKNDLKNPEKFAPFELVDDKDFNNYLNVITPIFNSLDIKFDKRDVETAFARRQLIFMLKNEIFTGDNLKEKIMNIKETNPEMIEVSSPGSSRIQDLYRKEDIAENIAENVKKRIHLNFADKFKEVFCLDNKAGFFVADNSKKDMQVYKFSDNLGQKKIGFKKQSLPKPGKPVTKAVFKLAKLGETFFAKNVKVSDYKYCDYSANTNQFLSYDECSEEQKRAIDKREKSLKKFSDSIDYNKDADTPGVISLVVVRENPMQFYKKHMQLEDVDDEQKKKEIIQIPITQRELVKMRVLPEEIGWEKEKKAKIQSSDKVIYVVPNEKAIGQNDFRDLLVEMAQSGSSTDEKISMENIKKAYKDNLKKDENEL